jgi:hypothetical protein
MEKSRIVMTKQYFCLYGEIKDCWDEIIFQFVWKNQGSSWLTNISAGMGEINDRHD